MAPFTRKPICLTPLRKAKAEVDHEKDESSNNQENKDY